MAPANLVYLCRQIGEVVSGAVNESLLMRESSVTLNNKQHVFPTASPSYSTSTSLASAMSPPTPWYGGLHPQPYKDAVERFEKLDIGGINYGQRSIRDIIRNVDGGRRERGLQWVMDTIVHKKVG